VKYLSVKPRLVGSGYALAVKSIQIKAIRMKNGDQDTARQDRTMIRTGLSSRCRFSLIRDHGGVRLARFELGSIESRQDEQKSKSKEKDVETSIRTGCRLEQLDATIIPHNTHVDKREFLGWGWIGCNSISILGEKRRDGVLIRPFESHSRDEAVPFHCSISSRACAQYFVDQRIRINLSRHGSRIVDRGVVFRG